jgi:hypothetical protein
MKLYRDLGKKIHVNSFYEKGELQISNLFSFRKLENQHRIDESEAIKSYVDYLNPQEYDSRFNIPIKIFDQEGKLLPDVTYYRRIEIANCFALSFFQENQKPETSVVIKDVQKFSDIIGHELNNKFGIGADIHGPCFYYESGDEKHEIISLSNNLFLKIHHQPILSAFLKEKEKYEQDQEYRMLWIPYYEKKAAVKILDKIRKYGYQFKDKYTYWPDYNDFPKLDEMIKEKLKITNTELIACSEK